MKIDALNVIYLLILTVEGGGRVSYMYVILGESITCVSLVFLKGKIES